MRTNEDFLFAQEALRQGYVTDAQVDEGFLLQKRMSDDLKLDERLAVILVKRGYLAEDQARRVYARIQPDKGQGEIRGYRLLEVVGRGAMGTVYKAIHLGLNREVALKILRPDLASDRTQVERLKAEAAMLASLDHPNVVRALDAGESNGFPYFVMEYVEGETLRDRLRREGQLGEDEALRITRGLADALERARRMGIVHRDVKPGNVLLTRNGTPKLMDLGLAKGPIDLGLTQHGATVGTPQYIAPEQAVDPRKADTRSDIYGLGATLYAMLTGKPPFDGQTLAEIITKVLYEAPVPVRTLRPEVSPETGYLVERMMLRDPSLRYKTPLAVVQDIDRLMQGTSILPTGFAGNWEAYLLRRRARRLLTVYVPTVAAAVLLSVGWKLWQDRVRHGEQSTVLTGRIADALGDTEILPTDTRQGVQDKWARVNALIRESQGYDPENREALERRGRLLEEENARFLELETVMREQVVPAKSGGQWAAADEFLAAFQRGKPSTSPAVRAAVAHAEEVRARSDEFLVKAREERIQRTLKSLADIVPRLRNWKDLVQGRFAATTDQVNEMKRTGDALREAVALEKDVGQALAAVRHDAQVEYVVRGDLTGLARALADRRGDALAALAHAGGSLSPFFSGTDISVLVRAGFSDADARAWDLVKQAWDRVKHEADELDQQRRWEEAIGVLEAFHEIAKDAYGLFADQARDKVSEIRRRTEVAQREADAAWKILLTDALRKDLQTGDTQALRRRVTEARADPVLFPVEGRLQGLVVVADRYDSLVLRALGGIDAHRGRDKDRWIDTVRLRDGRRGRLWEVLRVDPEARTFDVQSHSGGKTGPVETYRVRELADDQIAELAALVPGVAQDTALRAVYALSVFPFDEVDPHRLLADWGAVKEHFTAAGSVLDGPGGARNPMLGHAEETIAALVAETTRIEALARDSWNSAQKRWNESDLLLAGLHLRDLQKPPLRYSLLAKEKAAEIVRQIQEIELKAAANNLQKIFNGARIDDPHEDANGIFATITFDFDKPEQIREEIFPYGLARLVPAPPGDRPATPGKDENQALMLNPGREREATRDRPLVASLPLLHTERMTVGLSLWVTSRPSFFGIDLQGAQVGVLSADPHGDPFPPDVPRLDREKKPLAFNPYGRGRGVAFHAGQGFQDPADWGFDDPATWAAWDDGHHGRHFLDKEREAKGRKDEMGRRWFAFEARQAPYRLVFERQDDRLSLTVDGLEVYAESRPEWKNLGSTGRIEILSWATCIIDNLQVSGRIPKAWYDAKVDELAKTTGGATRPPPAPPTERPR